MEEIRKLDIKKKLEGKRIGMLMINRRKIVEEVEIRKRMKIGIGLNKILGEEMKKKDMRIEEIEKLEVKIKKKKKKEVRGRMMREEVDIEIEEMSIRNVKINVDKLVFDL